MRIESSAKKDESSASEMKTFAEDHIMDETEVAGGRKTRTVREG